MARHFRWLMETGGGQENADKVEPVGQPAEAVYEPSMSDVIVVKATLMESCQLPLELVNSILDAAEYWAHSSTLRDYTVLNPRGAEYLHGNIRENVFLVRTMPLGFTANPPVPPEADYSGIAPAPHPLVQEYELETLKKLTESPFALLEHPCRKIVFIIRSKDQGWVTNQPAQTYEGSWTWFEAGLERFDATKHGPVNTVNDLGVTDLHTVWPETITHAGGEQIFHHNLGANPVLKVQSNFVGFRHVKEHRVEWRWTDEIDPESSQAQKLDEAGRGRATGDGEFVRNLRLGDVVTLWAKARFPAWSNIVERVQIDVYWAV